MADLNDSQKQFLASMMKNTLTKPDVNWEQVAQEFGMTVKSAKERYRLLSIKLGWNDGPSSSSNNNGNNNSPSKPTPKKAGVTKRCGKVGDKAQKGAKGNAKGRGRPKKSNDVVKDESDGTDELAKPKAEDSEDES